ncbi:hypothetical protein P171DRAFT_520737 [Karstenula rhodostoma CBS 690.94]|uniref:Zn(2)-C6 fungal-type domain-containing protein n=1 Tax=Karstenula rhodostoma CBS 690.94 TaxID=1392251 RepID=A0A9P4UAK1_9PLEO|nr:hypothetical protein P171DRAFT_520737 [Karstenula rhodostoma CBS 690.94]
MIPRSNSAAAAPPQRQSCDRCHRQKLRCIRNKDNGDVCDRCLSKGAQCVFSSSLPKGRPSSNSRTVRRLTLEAKTTGISEASTPEVAPQILTTGPSSSERTVPKILPQLMEDPMSISMSTWPWPGATTWEETQSDMPWDGMDFNHSDFDDFLANSNALGSDANGVGELNAFSPIQSLSMPSPPSFHTHDTGKLGPGNYERQHGGKGNSVHKSLGENSISNFPNKSSNPVIAQLSHLSVQLSTLRASSHNLAQAADFSFGGGPNEGQSPLIDSAAFESVVAWLPPEESSATLDPRHSSNVSTDALNFWPSSTPQMGTPSGPGILRDVFSASHRLMEIIRNLRADDITRHLIMACEALLLEIYAAILTALQHEAYPGDTASATALGNVRLVLVVQLCGYLIERQHQAVGQCLAQTSIQNHKLPSPIPSGSSETECLKDLKAQVQQKLVRLRQMLRCS